MTSITEILCLNAKDKMADALKESKDLQKDLKDLERKMLEKKELTWEEKQKAEKLLERQKELNKKILKCKFCIYKYNISME